MARQHIFSLVGFVFTLSFVAALNFNDRAVRAAEPAATLPHDNDSVAQQIKELQNQIAELQSQVKELKSPRIVAAGTVTIRLGPQQDNKTSLRVKLPASVVAQLGSNYIIELTNRYPAATDGGSFFVAYWRPAADGFDILLADPSLVGVGLYVNRTTPYYVDWIVVRK